jgi:hypothetical protein
MKGDPVAEVVETVAEAGVDGVLEVGVRVDEAGDDRSVRERFVRPTELAGVADGDDDAVLDRDAAARDRGTVDREDPVGGENRR